MHVVTLSLAFLLGLICIFAGVAFSLWRNPKIGQLGNIIVADIFLTLGLTAMIGALTTCFPRVPVFRSLANRMYSKLCILGVVLAILFFVVLLFI